MTTIAGLFFILLFSLAGNTTALSSPRKMPSRDDTYASLNLHVTENETVHYEHEAEQSSYFTLLA